jgi:hypothetical protein
MQIKTEHIERPRKTASAGERFSRAEAVAFYWNVLD